MLTATCGRTSEMSSNVAEEPAMPIPAVLVVVAPARRIVTIARTASAGAVSVSDISRHEAASSGTRSPATLVSATDSPRALR